MRIRVFDVLEMLASEMTEAEILEDFDYLDLDDIRACLAYAAQAMEKAPAEAVHATGTANAKQGMAIRPPSGRGS